MELLDRRCMMSAYNAADDGSITTEISPSWDYIQSDGSGFSTGSPSTAEADLDWEGIKTHMMMAFGSSSPTAQLTGLFYGDILGLGPEAANAYALGLASVHYSAGTHMSFFAMTGDGGSWYSTAIGMGDTQPDNGTDPASDTGIMFGVSEPLYSPNGVDNWTVFMSATHESNTNAQIFIGCVYYVPVSVPAPGDLNGDGVVNDMDIFFQGQGSTAQDLNGDSSVTSADLSYLYQNILGTRSGDLDLDGDVDAADATVLAGNIGKLGSYSWGDVNGDLHVDSTDQALLAANLGFGVPGDVNHDGVANAADIDVQSNYSNPLAQDLNNDSAINGSDRTYLIETILDSKAGDFDLNGSVDFNDYMILQNHFSSSGGYADGDVDGNGVINFNDYMILQNNFGWTR